ncbi:HIT domain-containing protein [Candidatus Woesearchaeota archaeon]|jgi:histidine triad (HIT) family protein|nr:HIT domain-containing protein [Candidatus Woesearchaeota archaeon]
MNEQEELKEKVKNMSPEELRKFQKEQCIFCHIIKGEVQSKKIYEDDKCTAILDINPANPGHLLLLPKEHYAIMQQIPDEIIIHLSKITKDLSAICLKAFKAEGTTIFIANGLAAGQKAQHFMVHIIPRMDNDGLNLILDENDISKEELNKIKIPILKKINEIFNIKQESIEEKNEEIEVGEKEKPTEKDELDIKEIAKKVMESSKPKRFSKEDIDLDKISELFK